MHACVRAGVSVHDCTRHIAHSDIPRDRCHGLNKSAMRISGHDFTMLPLYCVVCRTRAISIQSHMVQRSLWQTNARVRSPKAGGLRATHEGMICHNSRLVPCVTVFQIWYTPGCRKKHCTPSQLCRPALNTNNLLSVSLGDKLASVVCTLFTVAITILHADCRSSGNPNLLLIANRQEMEKNL